MEFYPDFGSCFTFNSEFVNEIEEGDASSAEMRQSQMTGASYGESLSPMLNYLFFFIFMYLAQCSDFKKNCYIGYDYLWNL